MVREVDLTLLRMAKIPTRYMASYNALASFPHRIALIILSKQYLEFKHIFQTTLVGKYG